MHFFNTTTFISNECQASRARTSRHFSLTDSRIHPSVSVCFEAAAMFQAAVKKACPDLIEITTGEILDRDFTLATAYRKFGLSPKTPFVVINTGEAQRAVEEQREQSVQTPEELYRDGFPFPLESSDICLRVDLANLCDLGHRVPQWLKKVYATLVENHRQGIYAPALITYAQAKQYGEFVDELWQKARSLFSPELVEAIMIDEMLGFPRLLYPDNEEISLHTVGSSRLFSPVAVSKIIDAVLEDDKRRFCRINHEITRLITEDFTFWARSGGVKVIESYGVD